MRTPFRAPGPTASTGRLDEPFQRRVEEPRMRTYNSGVRPAATSTPPPEEPAPDGRPDAAAPETALPRRPRGENSLIDRHTTVEGNLRSSQDLRVEGRIQGEVVCDGKLTITEGATVQARVEAAEVFVAGAIEGEIVSRGLFKLSPSGRVRGSATAARITIEDGGAYEGELHMSSGADAKEAGPDALSASSPGRNGDGG